MSMKMAAMAEFLQARLLGVFFGVRGFPDFGFRF